MNVTAMIIPATFEIGFLDSASVDSGSVELQSFVQTCSVRESPFFNVRVVVPLSLIRVASCSALLPLRLALKLPTFSDSEEQLITTLSKTTSEKPNSSKRCCLIKSFCCARE